MHEDYYDDHCLVNFMGSTWYIIGARPGRLNVIRLEGTQMIGCIINTTKIDWDGYCLEAVEMLKELP